MARVADRTAVVIPIKRLEQAKSRLAGCLEPAERARLVLRLLDHVLGAVFAAAPGGPCLVVSADPVVRAHAVAAGALAIDEATPGGGQNRSLEWGRIVARQRWQPAALLVLSGDLPLITSADLVAIGQLGAADGTVVLAPDRRRVGTNALLLRPPDLLSFQFGQDSLRAHASAAESRGLRVQTYNGMGTAFDLDVPEDLDRIGGFAGSRASVAGAAAPEDPASQTALPLPNRTSE